MCGLTGLIDRSCSKTASQLRELADSMARTIAHRGPDDSGTWVSAEDGVAFGFRRLAILDLTPAGHQPMTSASGRYEVIYNGEIYNFAAIRAELEEIGGAPSWRGHSDTEVMLAGIEQWGLREALRRFIGMFGIALWDRSERTLHLIRDRVGVKPLYCGWAGETFLFGSELKPFLAYPGFDPPIDRDALALFMRHNYIPAPFTIYKGFRKVTPGTILTVRPRAGQELHEEPFWSFDEVVTRGLAGVRDRDDEETVCECDALLRDAVGLRMVSDVPLGVFLSGGIDSSVVVAMMQQQSSRPVKTFTIGFHEEGYNEAQHASMVARHLGTDHTELYVSPQDAMGVIPKIPSLYDEPFADSSQIPTYLVSALARQKVTVSLSGDGGDELFGGYNRYFYSQEIWNKVGWVPAPLRRLAAAGAMLPGSARWQRAFDAMGRFTPSRLRLQNAGDRIAKVASVVQSSTPDEIYLRLISHWSEPADLVLGSTEPVTRLNRQSSHIRDFTDRMMYLDLLTYLPDDILVKVDRASMGVSLEAREPLLDHRLIEFAWGLPRRMKIRNGSGKWLLREVLSRYVPRQMFERPKMGFGIPIDTWLRTGLRPWADELLAPRRLQGEGFLNSDLVSTAWHNHLSGKGNHQYALWNVLVFQQWLEHQRMERSAMLHAVEN